MKTIRMGVMTPVLVALAAFALAGGVQAYAQHDMSKETGPPKYIYLSNAELKLGHGADFVKLESEEIAALRGAKIQAQYFGLWSITGNSGRVIFIHGMDSLADLQKTHDEIMGNATVGPLIRKNNAAEGLLMRSHYGSIYRYQKDLSVNPGSLEQMRFMRIVLFHVRDGKQEAFEHLAKEYVKLYPAAVPDARWAIFQKAFGEGSGTTYILVTPLKSLVSSTGGSPQARIFGTRQGRT